MNLFNKASFKIISFDIFDTLLLRPYTDPQEVWKVLEEREKINGFAEARKEADRVSYQNASDRGGETSIEEAYALMPEKFPSLMDKEMKLEREVLRANPEVLDLWNELGKQGMKRILVSDMYLPKDFIESVLKKNGIDGWDKLYLSRDYDCRKTTGELFKVVLKEQNVAPSAIMHIGDNEYSDVKVPKSLGIQTIHYKKVISRYFDECPFAKHIDGRLAGTLAIGWHQFKHDNPNHTYWNKLGFMMGGVLAYMYVSWIVKTAKKLGKDRLLFVARDGYIWQKICNELYPEMKTEYIYAPRLTSIAVQGAIGSDPDAIADRKRYMEKHLKGVDTNKIKKEYADYIRQFNLDDNCAMVDGCSSGFSAQRLVEECIGHNVFCFYINAMTDMHCGGALYLTHGHGMEFQMLSEFLFGSPELPIRGIQQGKPIYTDDCPNHEQFKINVANEISDGAIACAKHLHEYKITTTPQEWLEYANTFMSNLSDDDHLNLFKVKNAGDVEQKHFIGLTWMPRPNNELIIRKVGRFSFEITCYTKKKTSFYHVSYRGVVKRTNDFSYEPMIIKTIC